MWFSNVYYIQAVVYRAYEHFIFISAEPPQEPTTSGIVDCATSGSTMMECDSGGSFSMSTLEALRDTVIAKQKALRDSQVLKIQSSIYSSYDQHPTTLYIANFTRHIYFGIS